MIEAEWLAWTNPVALLKCLGTRMSKRKYRLFACACYRRAWDRLSRHSQEAVETAERCADRKASWSELESVSRKSRGPTFLLGYHDKCRRDVIIEKVLDVLDTLEIHTWGSYHSPPPAETALLRCLLGNPFRPAVGDPYWLAWNNGTLPALAQAIYDDRAFDRLPILADALEDAGCTNADLLDHCRGGGDHVRGCWVVDLILGKE
jgi:hypothetical protein